MLKKTFLKFCLSFSPLTFFKCIQCWTFSYKHDKIMYFFWFMLSTTIITEASCCSSWGQKTRPSVKCYAQSEEFRILNPKMHIFIEQDKEPSPSRHNSASALKTLRDTRPAHDCTWQVPRSERSRYMPLLSIQMKRKHK